MLRPLLLAAVAAAAAARAPPVVPTKGAVATGAYRNMFVEAGYDAGDVQARLSSIIAQLFDGNPANETLLYPAGDASCNCTYLWDVGDNDVRTEGMSYGLMDMVQLGRQEDFDRLLRWWKRYMQHLTPGDPRYGYSSWHCGVDGHSMDNDPASDGETFFASALLYAAAAWGDAGEYNYTAEAALVFNAMLHKEDAPCGPQGCQSVTNMFGGFVNDTRPPLVVFVPYASASSFTDSSYHAPHLYASWAAAGANNGSGAFWQVVRNASRAFLLDTADAATSLSPDYATFAGAPTGGGTTFSFDAWRVARNVAVDAAWFADPSFLPRQTSFCNTLLAFFRGLPSWPTYGNQFTLAGQQTDGDHSPGLVAMNALCALASDQVIAWDFIDALWNTSTPAGQWRYYDGVLYAEAWLHLAGAYKALAPTVP
jgi:oligosaccharide reducing-end xylanase